MIFLNFCQILAIENLKNHIILALLICNIAFWLYVASGTKKKCVDGRLGTDKQKKRKFKVSLIPTLSTYFACSFQIKVKFSGHLLQY